MRSRDARSTALPGTARLRRDVFSRDSLPLTICTACGPIAPGADHLADPHQLLEAPGRLTHPVTAHALLTPLTSPRARLWSAETS